MRNNYLGYGMSLVQIASFNGYPVHGRHLPYIASKVPGRNEPCVCGSGKKYKKCCLIKSNGNSDP